MTKQDFALKYESGEFDNEETPKRVQKELDNRSRALFGMKTPKNIQSQKRIKVQASAKVFSDTSKSDDEILKEAYVFQDGKTYMIAIDTDDVLNISAVRQNLEKANPKIKWIIVPKGIVEPIINPEAIALTRKACESNYEAKVLEEKIKSKLAGQKAERERILEIIDKMDWYPWPERLVKLKKEIMQDDRT